MAQAETGWHALSESYMSLLAGILPVHKRPMVWAHMHLKPVGPKSGPQLHFWNSNMYDHSKIS